MTFKRSPDSRLNFWYKRMNLKYHFVSFVCQINPPPKKVSNTLFFTHDRWPTKSVSQWIAPLFHPNPTSARGRAAKKRFLCIWPSSGEEPGGGWSYDFQLPGPTENVGVQTERPLCDFVFIKKVSRIDCWRSAGPVMTTTDSACFPLNFLRMNKYFYFWSLMSHELHKRDASVTWFLLTLSTPLESIW